MGEQGEQDVAAVDRLLDGVGQAGAAFDLLFVELGSKPFACSAVCRRSASGWVGVFARVGDE